MNKIFTVWRVFRIGEEVVNPAKWKAGQITINAIAALLFAVAETSKAFGYEVPATPEQINGIAIGILSLGNIVFTVTTSKKVGLPARSPNNDASGSGADSMPKWGDDSNQL